MCPSLSSCVRLTDHRQTAALIRCVILIDLQKSSTNSCIRIFFGYHAIQRCGCRRQMTIAFGWLADCVAVIVCRSIGTGRGTLRRPLYDSGQQLTCVVSVLRENRGKFRLYRSICAVMNIYTRNTMRTVFGENLCQKNAPKTAIKLRHYMYSTFIRQN